MKFLKSRNKLSATGKSDEELIIEFKQSSNTAVIEILFDRYGHLLFAVCMNYLKNEAESKDAVLEIFSKLQADLTKYEIKNFGSWIHRVTKNYCFHQLKKRKHNESLDSSVILEKEDANVDVDDQSFFLNHLTEALETLNEEQRICVELFYLQEKTYEEIEKATGYSYNKVKSYIQNGKRNLKIYLSRKSNEQE